jgi:hypothetical protein
VALSTAAFERAGLHIAPDEFERLVAEAIERVLPAQRSAVPRQDLTAEEAQVLEEGGATLRPRATGAGSPLAQTAAEYAVLLAAALSVPEAARSLGVDGSRVRQRLAAHTLYGIRQRAGWRLPRFQFGEHGLVPGFDQVAPRLAGVDLVSAARWFTQPHIDLTIATTPQRAQGARRADEVEGIEERVSPQRWLELGRDPGVVVALAGELQGIA